MKIGRRQRGLRADGEPHQLPQRRQMYRATTAASSTPPVQWMPVFVAHACFEVRT
jgi:hypothetical protein